MKTLSLLLLLLLLPLVVPPTVLATPQAPAAVERVLPDTLHHQQLRDLHHHHERVWEPSLSRIPASELSSERHAAGSALSSLQPQLSSGSTHAPSKPARNTSIDLHFIDQGSYTGDISLGTPPQTFRMLFSMASPTVWIPNFVGDAANRHYNHSQSSTYTENGTVYDARPFYKGFLSQDTMQIGSFAIEHQGFVEMDTINEEVIPLTHWDGVFGLGFEIGHGATQIKMPFHALVDSGMLSEPLFAFYFNKHAGKGAMTIGATDSNHYTGELVFVDVIRRDSWTVKLDDIRVNGRNMTKNRRATLWAEWPGLQGPKNDVATLANAVGAKLVGSFYELDCSSQGPDIEILIGGKHFALSKADYTGQVTRRDSDEGAVCQWAIQNAILGTDNGWIFGVAFIEKVYSVFYWGDPKHDDRDRKIGFALRA